MDFVVATLKGNYRFNMNELIFFRNFMFQVDNEKNVKKFHSGIKNPSKFVRGIFYNSFIFTEEICLTN